MSFTVNTLHTFDIKIPFTRESWAGRIRTCRGIGASLNEEVVRKFNKEHMTMLNRYAPESFDVLHQIVIRILKNN